MQNRSRFCLEIMDHLIEVFGPGRVGIKLTPLGRFGDMYDENPLALLEYLFNEFNKRNIAFVELKKDQEPENAFDLGYPSSQS